MNQINVDFALGITLIKQIKTKYAVLKILIIIIILIMDFT